MASKGVRVLVVDDSAVVRSVIADGIAATPGMTVVGKAGDGRQAPEDAAVVITRHVRSRWAMEARV